MDKIEILKKIISEDFEFSGNFSIDSRSLKKGDVFFAIRGGNNFVKAAIKHGCFPIYEEGDYEAGIKVEDTTIYMQNLAKEYRKYLKMPVIAVTGSNGKTTVKDVIANLLDKSYKTMGNYNNHIGLPLTILNCPVDSKYLVLELGMSYMKEIDLLASICLPDISIITNIGDSHIEHLKTRDNVFKAKTELIPYTKDLLIVSLEDEYLKNLKNACKIHVDNVKIFDYGTRFTFEGKEYETNLYGKHNALDVAFAIKVLEYLKLDVDKEKLKNLSITKMRFELINKETNIYINDAYNAAPKSVESSLLTLNEIFKDKDKYIVLGDMLELGDKEIEYHKSLEKTLDKMEYKKLFLYGNLMSNVAARDSIKTLDKEEIKRYLKDVKNSIIFLKGSRGMKLEEIIGSDN